MTHVKILIAAPFKEKALLAVVLNNKLRESGISSEIMDKTIEGLINHRYADPLEDLKEEKFLVDIHLENFINTNVTEDVKTLLDEFKESKWVKTDASWDDAIKAINERLRQILMI